MCPQLSINSSLADGISLAIRRISLEKSISCFPRITIVGSTDLVAETFDYEFAVQPGVSKTLPVIGAIAGGPIGAAAGLALQALLRDALGQAAEARYTIRGTWDEPLIEAVEKRPKDGSAEKSPESDNPAES